MFARRSAVRIGAGAAVAGLLTVLWAPAANAAPALTIPLDPPVVMVAPYPVENFGPLTLAGLDGDTYAPVEVQWGGAVVVELPATLDGSAMEVTLGLAPTDEDPPTLEYSTENLPPDLTVTPLGGGQFSIAMPADNAVDGPIGYLTVDGLTSPISGVEVMPADYLLEFDASYPALQNLVPDLFAVAAAPCALSSTACPERTLTAGESFALTVPASSALRQLGLGTFDDVSMTLEEVTDPGIIELATAAADAAAVQSVDGAPVAPVVEEMAEAVSQAVTESAGEAAALDLNAAGVVAAASTYSATATVPSTVQPGSYLLTVMEAGVSGGASMTMLDLEVAAPQVVNAGLRSNTGWNEPVVFESSAGDPLNALGGGLLLIAGLGTVAALQGRRTRAE